MADLSRRLPDLKIAIAGARWQSTRAEFSANTTIAGPLTGDGMSRALAHSKIGIAIHHGPGGRHGWQDDVSTRTFEFPACGTFMLHIDNPHVRTLFDVPADIDVFADGEELAEKVRYYLDHPDQREAAAERAFHRVVPSRSYFEIGLEIGEAISRHIAGKS
jgi:spore maturation protein CgeB